jgi:hypothetical protein
MLHLTAAIEENHVHTFEFGGCAVDDDHERGLLGFMGQHV